MAYVVLPRSLLALFPAAARRCEIDADSVAGLIDVLDGRWPGMRDRLSENTGPRIRAHINVFVDGEPATIKTSLGPESVVHIIPAVSGGERQPRARGGGSTRRGSRSSVRSLTVSRATREPAPVPSRGPSTAPQPSSASRTSKV